MHIDLTGDANCHSARYRTSILCRNQDFNGLLSDRGTINEKAKQNSFFYFSNTGKDNSVSKISAHNFPS
jgi:hypothetical protein